MIEDCDLSDKHLANTYRNHPDPLVRYLCERLYRSQHDRNALMGALKDIAMKQLETEKENV